MYPSSSFGPERDRYFMNRALVQARRAYAHNEVPIGALVVNADGVIVGRGYNAVERMQTQAAHAEIRALRQAGKKQGDWRLEGCWLYCTLEPCAMCMGLINLSRLAGVVFGAASPLFGYRLDNVNGDQVYKRDTQIIEGVGAQESAQLLKDFFKRQRERT